MIFRNKHKERLEIVPVGWDPAEEWVIVKVVGQEESGFWDGTDHSLMRKEALELADWLDSINQNDNTSITFMEPELEFHYKDGTLKISLEYKYRPPWNQKHPDSELEYALHFEVKFTVRSNLVKLLSYWGERSSCRGSIFSIII